MLILNELRYQNELVTSADLKIPVAGKPTGKEIDMAVQLIDQLTVSFNPEEYKDTFSEEVKHLIKQKAKGKPVHPATSAPKSTKVHDIMSLLQASLKENKKVLKKTKKTKTA